MSLTALNWKRTAGVIPAANTPAGILDALYTAGTSVLYWDGVTVRTPGSGSAWTWAKAGGTTETAYGTPPSGSLANRVILAGATSAKTPTMATPDTWAINMILAGIAKNAGAYNAWDNAAPFTSGQFYGYWRALATASFTVAKVHLIESQEAVVIVLEAVTGACQFITAGAVFDPETSMGTAAESDGRRYSLSVPPSTAATNATFMETNTSTMSHSVAASSYHHMVADIGAVATFVTVNKLQLFQCGAGTSVTASSMANAGSEVIGMPFAVGRTAAAPNDNFIGVSRQFGCGRNIVSMTTRQLDGADVYHNVGSSTSVAGNALGFKV